MKYAPPLPQSVDGLIESFEVLRTRLRQTPMENGQQRYNGLRNCFRTILKEEGLAAMYGGLTAHLLRVIPSTAIIFGTYEAVMRVFDIYT